MRKFCGFLLVRSALVFRAGAALAEYCAVQ